MPAGRHRPFPANGPGLGYLVVRNPEWFADAVLKYAGRAAKYQAAPGVGVLWAN
jgi:hypothetical protein